jgi:Polyketide cyclase / dehydrase and lipid transport
MPHFADTVHSPAPRGAVFDYLANFASAAEWDPSVTEAVALDPEPGPGARYRVVVKALGRETPYVYETIEFDRPSLVVVRAETSSVVSLDTISFAEAGAGTDVTYDARLTLKGLYRLFELPMSLGFKRLAENAREGLERELGALGGETRP